jgi:cytochrome c2
MGYAGVSDPKERADLIAYLKEANDTPQCRK